MSSRLNESLLPRGRMARSAKDSLLWTIRVTIVAATVTCATQGFAQDRADIDRTQIIGNRELPKVLYIVPWKKPLPGDLSGRPMASVLDEVLSPVDRDVFRRQVRYDSMTQAQPSAPATK